jgi:signal transduction histidine kinase
MTVRRPFRRQMDQVHRRRPDEDAVASAPNSRPRAGGQQASSGRAPIERRPFLGDCPLVSAAWLCDHLMVSSSVSFPDEGAEPRAAALEKAPSRRIEVLLVAAAAVGLSFAAYRVQVQAHSRHAWAAAQVTVASAFVVAGLVAWLRRPTNRLGPLMLATGVAYLARQLRYSQDALLFTVFFLLGDLAFALAGHSILAYPSGRVHGRAPRLLVKAGYTAVLAFPFAVLLLHGTRYPLLAMGPLPPHSLLGVSDNPRAVELLQKSEIVVFFGVLASMFVAVIVQRLLQATPRARRMLAPLLLAAVAIALRAVYECVHTFVNRQPFAYSYLFWWQVAAFIALPLALLAGMLRARLARANIGELVLELDRAPATPRRLRDALARTLADPSLELYFWLPERAEWVDAGGTMVSLPDADTRRAVTTLEHDGEPVAAVVHDPSLLDEPKLVEAASAAARLALENARLHAETRAQLQQVRESRRRIVSAADAERHRIERNLHDGAQQRLLALALELSKAQRRSDYRAAPEVQQLLTASVEELQATVEELRTLARGLHPTVLTEYGLAAAVESLTHKSPVPVTVDVCEERLPMQVEATAYFVASEALTNIVKHAQAGSASITARHERDKLLLEIADDGIGGAHAREGSGLQGLTDRVEALGGRLRIRSPAGQGTRIGADIPCAP